MDHPSVKSDNSILFKSSFLRRLKYNNFVLPTLLSIIVSPEKSRYELENMEDDDILTIILMKNGKTRTKSSISKTKKTTAIFHSYTMHLGK
jgi:hypothetical protein